MAKVADILEALERVAPSSLSLPGDRVGLQVGSRSDAVSHVVVSLDRSLEVARHCRRVGAELLISHHPLIWNPLHQVDTNSGEGAVLGELLRGGVAFIAAHTNWDCAPGGVNDTLALLLELRQVRSFGAAAQEEAAKVVVFVPTGHDEAVIDAMSAAGAGEIGAYSRCAFRSKGTGSFVPEAGSNPTVGHVGEPEQVEEMRVEMRVPASKLSAVLDALVAAHPYEEPAYDVVPLRVQPLVSLGRVGVLDLPMSLSEFVGFVGVWLGFPAVGWGEPNRVVRTVAVVGGAGADQWRDAREAGAEVLVTGEVPQHEALAAFEAGFGMVQAGHFATENPAMKVLALMLQEQLTPMGVKVEFWEPEPGRSGRPIG